MAPQPLALLRRGLALRRADAAVVTNAMGCGERPAPWMLELAAGRQVIVVGDADRPGEQGAAVWAAAFAGHATEARQVRLPYEVTETHGKDLRDWLAEGHGWADLLELAAGAPVVQPMAAESTQDAATPESVDDPHRLARLNLNRYASDNQGRTLRYWRDEWYVWKRHRYRKISENEFRAKLSASIKQEFDRAFRAGETDEVRKVTGGLVSNVMLATAGYVNMSAEIEFGTWLENRTRRAYVSMENGILDIDAVLSGAEESACLLPHSPQWFSLVSVPYAFNSDAGAEPANDHLTLVSTCVIERRRDPRAVLRCRQGLTQRLESLTLQGHVRSSDGHPHNPRAALRDSVRCGVFHFLLSTDGSFCDVVP
jgi:hypothetical protein